MRRCARVGRAGRCDPLLVSRSDAWVSAAVPSGCGVPSLSRPPVGAEPALRCEFLGSQDPRAHLGRGGVRGAWGARDRETSGHFSHPRHGRPAEPPGGVGGAPRGAVPGAGQVGGAAAAARRCARVLALSVSFSAPRGPEECGPGRGKVRRVGIPVAPGLPFKAPRTPATSLLGVATSGVGGVAQLRCVDAVLIPPHFRTRQKVHFF